MSERINYQDECRAYLKLKAQGEKVTQAKYCQMRSTEIDKTVSLAYFKKVMRMVKGKLPSSRQSKQTAAGQKVTPKDTFDWECIKADFMSGPYRSVAQFCRGCGIEATTGFYKKAKGWRNDKATAGLIPKKNRVKNQTVHQKVENDGDLTVRIVIRCPPGANITLDVQSTDPVLAAVEVPDGKA
ncbi:hypothetical protein DSCA_30260 [Desulfosarcina alkanivorans]|uniref:Uncharacterized protein n=1 Tax=Desulfosarcina alkanivorans TaxID=571177 RepID=A0A5K7YIV7_9BACT|nr:hypothetical protein [Desulfosarcina alkanivorans]BBO69096.1 hypothetical protein DSCA_30260 [Desulfosarcina alkanivorans]